MQQDAVDRAEGIQEQRRTPEIQLTDGESEKEEIVSYWEEPEEEGEIIEEEQMRDEEGDEPEIQLTPEPSKNDILSLFKLMQEEKYRNNKNSGSSTLGSKRKHEGNESIASAWSSKTSGSRKSRRGGRKHKKKKKEKEVSQAISGPQMIFSSPKLNLNKDEN